MARCRRAACAVARRHPVPTHQMLGWYDANVGVDQAADAGAVSSWADKSGNGRTLTQGTGANQPTYRALGNYGMRAVRGDGSNDKLANTSASPFAGRSQASIALVFNATTSQVDRYVQSQPENAAGTNGVDARFVNSTSLRWFIKTDTTTNEVDVGTSYSTAKRAVGTEFQYDLSRSGDELIGIGSSGGFQYEPVGGSTLDASSGQFSLFDFSAAGFSAAAAMEYHEVCLLLRPMSPGERRRWWRYVGRRWQALRPDGPWADGTLGVML